MSADTFDLAGATDSVPVASAQLMKACTELPENVMTEEFTYRACSLTMSPTNGDSSAGAGENETKSFEPPRPGFRRPHEPHVLLV